MQLKAVNMVESGPQRVTYADNVPVPLGGVGGGLAVVVPDDELHRVDQVPDLEEDHVRCGLLVVEDLAEVVHEEGRPFHLGLGQP